MAKWDAEHQARQARANADAVSVSATNTGSDRMIVEKIVQTISEKVDKKELERW
jgi:dihydroorotate dehydrogenase